MRALAVVIIVAAIGLAACSDGSAPSSADRPAGTDSPQAAAGVSDEAALRQAAQEYNEAYLANKTMAAYSFWASDWQARCSLADFTAVVTLLNALWPDLAEADVEITGVRIEDGRGYVDWEMRIDGRPVDLGAEPEYPPYWVKEDGQWRRTDNDPAPCDVGD